MASVTTLSLGMLTVAIGQSSGQPIRCEASYLLEKHLQISTRLLRSWKPIPLNTSSAVNCEKCGRTTFDEDIRLISVTTVLWRLEIHHLKCFKMSLVPTKYTNVIKRFTRKLFNTHVCWHCFSCAFVHSKEKLEEETLFF